MTLKGKLEATMELKSPAEKFFNVWKKEAHQIPNHTPSNIQSVNVHEGSWDTHGSIKLWNYTCDGKEEVFKEKVEHDDANMSITLVGLEGHVMDTYKVYIGTWQLLPETAAGNGSSVKLTMVYETREPGTPPPYKYFDFMISLTRDIDEGLSKA